ncbi:hypothetical protein GCM10009555_066420 [Acrocarpospora macrocephala]|uniref:Uncharacterized protein n=1 Tax=Acrocarpospora macrocephala TaxID=150177 RepID=A0A5M3WWR6_9ACTN|nr:hypothetical protein [Acrocarpospora macrocephala]GES13374.1 hypothetical protein Amac_069710 [Acrocarpospora macrocephala]
MLVEEMADRPQSPPSQSTFLSNATRYLCAAAYIDPAFRDKVVDELLADNRAVAPSYGGLDVSPVLAHCLRSQRFSWMRDGAITVLMLLGVLLNPASLGVLLLALPFALLALSFVKERRVLRVVVIIWAAWNALTLIASLAVTTLLALLSTGAPLIGGLNSLAPRRNVADQIAVSLASLGTIFTIAAFLVGIAYWVGQYILLSKSFRPGEPHVIPFTDYGTDVRRQNYIKNAQWGNLTLYDGEDPFIGAGATNRAWSIVVELDRRRPEHGKTSGTRRNTAIDPVQLHTFVRERLAQMRDDVVNPEESIVRLAIKDHLTAPGTFRRPDWNTSFPREPWLNQSHPLIDEHGFPRFTLDDDAIQAVIRHPQGAMRYYQRVTIGAEGPPVTKPDGQAVMPGIDREIDISAFIYLAVEGRMLYTQFLVTALPPCKREYHIIDVLPAMTSPVQVALQALRAVRLQLAAEILFAPFRLVGLIWRELMKAITKPNPARFRVFPFGSRQSVRELGAEPEPTSFMQVLDIDKYSKLISQRLTEAVLDYLEDQEIDTAIYRQQASTVVNYGALITGGTITGPVAAGAAATATQSRSN